jgi:hypothetical protein
MTFVFFTRISSSSVYRKCLTSTETLQRKLNHNLDGGRGDEKRQRRQCPSQCIINFFTTHRRGEVFTVHRGEGIKVDVVSARRIAKVISEENK